MRFDYVIIGFVIISVFVLGGTMMMHDMNTNYANLNISNISDSDFGTVYNTIDEMYNQTEESKVKTLNGEISDQTSWESMTKGSYSAIRLMAGSFGLFTDITNAIAAKIGIPNFLVKAAFIVFTVLLIFSIIFMIFRFIPR